jgi:hypothetical protein
VTSDRRSFLKQAALTAAGSSLALGAASAAPPAEPGAQATRALDALLLAALGHALLPESLGSTGRDHAVSAFVSWIAAYRPVTEEMHGYGDAEITYTPADPAPGWNAQLHALDLLAHRKHRRAFAQLDIATRRSLVGAQLTRVRISQLPSNPLTAPHVAVALLAHWAGSGEATDLAYGVRIAKGNCRMLAESPRKPLPLAAPERR